ncbi:hypothetical protein ACQP1W_28130 [Spirillospora sp. CA-255316]
MAAVATITLVLVAIFPWAVLPACINERFPTSVRASDYGLVVVLPSLYALYQAGRGRLTPFDHTGTVLPLVGALLVVSSAPAGPGLPKPTLITS